MTLNPCYFSFPLAQVLRNSDTNLIKVRAERDLYESSLTMELKYLKTLYITLLVIRQSHDYILPTKLDLLDGYASSDRKGLIIMFYTVIWNTHHYSKMSKDRDELVN
jgi:hypothetical protein